MNWDFYTAVGRFREGLLFQAFLGENLQHHQWKLRPTFPEPPGTEGVFPSSLLLHQPSITLLPSAGSIPFGIWQYFLPPVNGLAQTEDPQPSLESCTLLMGTSPKATRTGPWGGRNVTPSSGPAQCQAGQHRHTSPCPPWRGFLAPGSLPEEGHVGCWGPWWAAGPIMSPQPRPRAQYPKVKEPLEVSV